MNKKNKFARDGLARVVNPRSNFSAEKCNKNESPCDYSSQVSDEQLPEGYFQHSSKLLPIMEKLADEEAVKLRKTFEQTLAAQNTMIAELEARNAAMDSKAVKRARAEVIAQQNAALQAKFNAVSNAPLTCPQCEHVEQKYLITNEEAVKLRKTFEQTVAAQNAMIAELEARNKVLFSNNMRLHSQVFEYRHQQIADREQYIRLVNHICEQQKK
jgi:hypothetical protein